MAKKYFNVVKSDEWYTPKFAVEMIAKHLKPHSIIWCPFDGPDSWFVKVFSELGHFVYFSHLKIGIGSNLNYENEMTEYLDLKGLEPDFFDNQIEIIRNLGGGINYIISNPPFSLKTQILTRLYEFGIPFAMLMQLNSAIETEPRQTLYKKYGVQLLVPNSRVWYYSQTWEKPKSSAVFMSGFVCWNVLDNPLIFDTWDKTHLL